MLSVSYVFFCHILANIKTVYYCATKKIANMYGFRDEKIYKELKANKKTIKFVEIKNKDYKSPFEEWKNKKDKIKY